MASQLSRHDKMWLFGHGGLEFIGRDVCGASTVVSHFLILVLALFFKGPCSPGAACAGLAVSRLARCLGSACLEEFYGIMHCTDTS